MDKHQPVISVAYNTIFQLAGKFVSMIITVLVTIIVAKYLGVRAYGDFSLMQNWPALFFIIVDFGFNAIAVKEITRDWSMAGRYFLTILVMRIVFSLFLITALMSVIIMFPYDNSLKLGIILSLFLILTQGLYATGNIIFQVKLRYDLSTYAYLVGYIFVLSLTLLFIRMNLGVIPVSMSYVAGGLVTFIVMVYFIRSKYTDISYSFDPVLMKNIIKGAAPIGLMFIFSQINFKSDSILLSIIELPKNLGHDNNTAVAVYSLPYKVFEVALVVPTFLMNSIYPGLLRAYDESAESLKKLFVKSVLLLFGIAVIGSLLGVILAPVIIDILGGSDFADSVLVLRMLFSALFIYFITQPISWLIVTLGNQKSLPKIYLMSAMLNVTLNIIFIPKYGFYASSIITHISEFFILLMLSITARKLWRLHYA